MSVIHLNISQREYVNCEACGTEHDIEVTTLTADSCYLCPQCNDDSLEAYQNCQHSWRITTDEYGDRARYCDNCSFLIRK